VVSTVGSDTLVTYLVGNAAASDASKTAITNVPTGTRYEETDTRKIFRMKVGASYDNDFASNSSTGWTLTPTYSTISGGTLNIQNTSSGHQHYASYDLGSGAVAENWVLRFKIIFDTYGHNQQGQACGYYFGLSSIPAASLTGETPTQGSYVAFNAAAHWSGSTQFYLAANSSGTQSTTGDSRADDLTITRYIEIVKNGTSLTNKIFTANTYAENVREETITLTLSANITNLRYIYNKFYYQGVTTDNTVKVDDIEFYNNSLTTFTEAWLEKGIA